MADRELRDLERRFRATGSVEDEARWIAVRLGIGALDHSRVDLAAFLGHPASRLALVEAAPTPPNDAEALFQPLCREVQIGVRAALALMTDSFRLLAHGHRPCPWIAHGCRRAESACRAWAICPCDMHAREAHTVASERDRHADAAGAATTEIGDWWSYQAVETAYFLPAAIALSAGLSEPTPHDPVGPDASGLVRAVCIEFAGFPSNVERSLEGARRAVELQLAPWLLGYRDPLRDDQVAPSSSLP